MYGVCGKEERVPGENIKLVPHKVVSPEFTLNSCTVGSLRVGLIDMVKESIQSRVVKEQLATAGDGL